MVIAKTTAKGHVIIPATLRKKYNIKKGTRVAISEGEGNVVSGTLLINSVGIVSLNL